MRGCQFLLAAASVPGRSPEGLLIQRTLLALTLVVTHVAVTAAAELPTPAQRCAADLVLASAKFASCRLTAESRFARDIDEVHRGTALAGCSERLQRAIGRATSRYGLNCSAETVDAIDAYLTQCSNDVVAASALNGSLPRCGNGRIDVVGEQCDGGDLGGASCAQLGLPGGVLQCKDDCHLDVSGCLTPPTPTPTPLPTATPEGPIVMPGSASLRIGESQVFTVTTGVPPYTVNDIGGTAVPRTVISVGGTFTYTKTQSGTFVLYVVDSNGGVGTAMIME